MPRLPRPAFCLVTPGTVRSADGAEADNLVRRVVRAAGTGVNVIQIREPQLPDVAIYDLASRVLRAIDRSHTLVVVNDRADLALAAGTDGVHLRADGVAAARLRTIVPPGFVIGRSVHSVDEAVTAEAHGGIDYLMFGTVFPSGSKPPNHPVAGLALLRTVCASVQLPVIAIGGVTSAQVPEIAAAGAAGFAAIGTFIESDRAGASVMSELVREARRAFGSKPRAYLE
jgi:thiamine-phosphate pyrophosphorylase